MLSVEPWLVELILGRAISRAPDVSVLSVEPWLVELRTDFRYTVRYWGFQCSQSSRGWWNCRDHRRSERREYVSVLSVEPWLVELASSIAICSLSDSFSALSRAVVGGTPDRRGRIVQFSGFSALSRAVVGGTSLTMTRRQS